MSNIKLATLKLDVNDLFDLAATSSLPYELRLKVRSELLSLAFDGLKFREQLLQPEVPQLNEAEKSIAVSNKINAIKMVRDRYYNTSVRIGDMVQTGLGLKDAKDLVDVFLNSRGAG